MRSVSRTVGAHVARGAVGAVDGHGIVDCLRLCADVAGAIAAARDDVSWRPLRAAVMRDYLREVALPTMEPAGYVHAPEDEMALAGL